MLKSKLLPQKIAATLAAGTFLLASPALAAENIFQFDQITVTADRITQTVAETPENVTVITNQQLQDKGARTLADALTGVSGVTVSSYGGLGSKAIPYILGSDRVVLMIDGKRMNLPQGIGTGAGGIDLNSYMISADNIERIEVVKGGASVLYGADAVGGVINIITKKGEGSTHVNTSIAAGNYGGRNYEISASGQEKQTHWQFSGQQNNTDGQRINSASKDKNFSLRLDQDLVKDQSLTFTYDYYGNHAGVPNATTSIYHDDWQDILRHNWSIAYTKKHTDGDRILRYYNNDQLYSGTLNVGSTWGDYPFKYRNTVKAFEYQDSARISQIQLLTWGGEWRNDKVISSDSNNIPHEGTTKAVYLQDQISMTDKDNLTLGLRHDNNDLYGKHWLPKLAYLHQANQNTSYFANWGKIFKAPKFDDLFGDSTTTPAYSNTNLKAETGWTAEAGVKSKISTTTEAALSLFKREINNAIRWQEDTSDAAFYAINYYYPYHPYNVDHLTSIGANASLTSQLSAVTNMDIGYTYLDSHDQNNASVGDPRHTFHLGFNVHEGKLSQSIYGIFKDKSAISTNQVPSNFIINTNTNYALNKNTALFLKINNLFDRQYESVKYYPANGRSFLFGVKYSM